MASFTTKPQAPGTAAVKVCEWARQWRLPGNTIAHDILISRRVPPESIQVALLALSAGGVELGEKERRGVARCWSALVVHEPALQYATPMPFLCVGAHRAFPHHPLFAFEAAAYCLLNVFPTQVDAIPSSWLWALLQRMVEALLPELAFALAAVDLCVRDVAEPLYASMGLGLLQGAWVDAFSDCVVRPANTTALSPIDPADAYILFIAAMVTCRADQTIALMRRRRGTRDAVLKVHLTPFPPDLSTTQRRSIARDLVRQCQQLLPHFIALRPAMGPRPPLTPLVAGTDYYPSLLRSQSTPGTAFVALDDILNSVEAHGRLMAAADAAALAAPAVVRGGPGSVSASTPRAVTAPVTRLRHHGCGGAFEIGTFERQQPLRVNGMRF